MARLTCALQTYIFISMSGLGWVKYYKHSIFMCKSFSLGKNSNFVCVCTCHMNTLYTSKENKYMNSTGFLNSIQDILTGVCLFFYFLHTLWISKRGKSWSFIQGKSAAICVPSTQRSSHTTTQQPFWFLPQSDKKIVEVGWKKSLPIFCFKTFIYTPSFFKVSDFWEFASFMWAPSTQWRSHKIRMHTIPFIEEIFNMFMA